MTENLTSVKVLRKITFLTAIVDMPMCNFFFEKFHKSRGEIFFLKYFTPSQYGKLPKTCFDPPPISRKKILGKYFLGAPSVAPSQKSEAILGNIFIPKNVGGPPLRHLVGTFSPKSYSFRANIRET